MKRKTTWIISSACCVMLACLGLGLFSRSSVASAQNNSIFNFEHYTLNNGSLKGTYAGILSGTLIGGPAPTLTAVSYVHKLDGNGQLTNGKATVNINGQVFPNVDYAGTYTVNSDGTISTSIVPSNGPLAGVTILSNGVATEIEQGRIVEYRDMFHTGIVATGVIKRIRGL
jgi:hypothetical protein